MRNQPSHQTTSTHVTLHTLRAAHDLSCRLVITGSGFSKDKFAGGNAVYVGSYPCTVLNHKTTDTLVRGLCV